MNSGDPLVLMINLIGSVANVHISLIAPKCVIVSKFV